MRVNALAPGYIRTAMVDELDREGKIDLKRIEGRTPLGRLGLPLEIAHAAAFLASDLAAYVTGVLLPVDGGWDSFGGSGEVQARKLTHTHSRGSAKPRARDP